jgi:diguanylate cyclase (GGDEF)-like protein
MGFYVSVMTPISRIVASLQAVAAGDLTQRVVVQTRDEMAFVAEALNETVSRTRQATDLLTEQATIDSLTGLPNRVLMLRRLDDVRAAAGGLGGDAERGGWVLFVDLDRFKMVNDSFGHESGDEVLREVAYRLRSLAPPGVVAGRLAGDEFVLVAGPTLTSDDARQLGLLVVTRLSEQIRLNSGRRTAIGASVGIAAITGDASSEELLRRADVAMYEAKKHGRGQSEMYDEAMSAVVESRLQTQTELRDALESGGLTAYYQPIVDVGLGRTAGFEALVRWNHPERGLLLPGDFVADAEESGLIVPLGTSMLATACRQLAAWQSLHPDSSGVYVSVNVSPVQLSNPDFVAVVTGVLAETRIAPHCLCLEITETTLMADVDRVRRVLADLRRLGVRLAIDDFGIGHSSLAYLSRFPVQTLKLDRSFVSGMLHDQHDAAIVAMLVGLGRSLDLSVVAEGVESTGQRDHLHGVGYDTMQGFLFGRPGPAESQGIRLRTHRPDPLTDPFFAVEPFTPTYDVPLLGIPSPTG